MEQYVLSNPSEVVHLFVLLHGFRQLCPPLAAQCGLAEQVCQFNNNAKSIVSVVRKVTIFADVQYYIYAVGGRVQKSEKNMLK